MSSPNNLLGRLSLHDSDAVDDFDAIDVNAGVDLDENNDEDSTSSQDSERDPDVEPEEDFDYPHQEEEDGDDTGTNFGVIGQAVKPANDKYTEKWNKYKAERASLVRDGLILQGKPAKQQGIDIDRRVKMRRGDRKGYVVEKDGERMWSVRFDNAPNTIENGIPSTSLNIIKDKRILEWKCIEDSFPDDPIHEFQDHGVVGFDFERFDKEKLSLDNEDYDFPYLRLLIHLWPGKIFFIIKITLLRTKCII